MKKLLLLGALVTLSFVSAQEEVQQDQEVRTSRIGITAGALTGFAKGVTPGFTQKESSTGFYAGLFADVQAGENFYVQPGVNYANIDDAGAFQIPLMLKYYPTGNFNLQFGPQIMFDLSDIPSEMESMYNRTNFAFAFGVGFDFAKDFMAEARYSAQLNNHLKNAPDGYKVKANYLNIGIGYKF